MHCTKPGNDTDLVYWYVRHLFSIDGGFYLPPTYMSCIRSSNDTDLVYWYAKFLCLIDGGPICIQYICIVPDLAIKLIWCTGMQSLCA